MTSFPKDVIFEKRIMKKYKPKMFAEHTAIERQIQSTDAQIDQLFYQIYGVTEEEIKIVEQS